MEEKNNMPTLSRVEQGRQSQREGQYFEDRVGELYRLLRYNVEHGRLFSGHQVDLFLTGRFGDLTLHRAIECKAGPVKAEHIDEFIAKLRLVRRGYPAAQGTIISGVSFTDAIAAQAVQEGIQLTLYRDLAAQLFDGHGYVRSLIAECESNEQYNISMYIEPYIGYETAGEKFRAFEVVGQWLRDSQWNQLTLLGDVGTGKSFLSRMIAYRLAKDFLERPLEAPVPILVDLRNADRQFSLEGLILTHLVRSGLPSVSFDIFQYALAQGYVVLILDGFDEMSARVTRQVTNRNFHELSRSVKGKAKVLLTCRTHYFKSRTEEEEVVLGSKQDYGSETARDLYWELIARKGFRIAYLRPFELSQIEEYVGRARPGTAKNALKRIRGTYNLMELSQRPMLLEMIVKSIDKLTSSEINASTLYQVFTDAWIHRDKWRDVLSPELKLNFLIALARSLWEEDVSTIHYTRLIEYLRQELALQVQDAQALLEMDSEIRTASFLARDDFGYYGLVHKSYSEFFLAKYIASRLEILDFSCLATRRLTPEVISFLRHMVSLSEVELALEGVLVGDYTPRVSENAVLCLYGFRREALINELDDAGGDKVDNLAIYLPTGARLSGARLEQVALEGVILRAADLRGVKLDDAILSYADFSESDFEGAELEKADLTNACLVRGNFASAVLVGANLEGADLTLQLHWKTV